MNILRSLSSTNFLIYYSLFFFFSFNTINPWATDNWTGHQYFWTNKLGTLLLVHFFSVALCANLQQSPLHSQCSSATGDSGFGLQIIQQQSVGQHCQAVLVKITAVRGIVAFRERTPPDVTSGGHCAACSICAPQGMFGDLLNVEWMEQKLRLCCLELVEQRRKKYRRLSAWPELPTGNVNVLVSSSFCASELQRLHYVGCQTDWTDSKNRLNLFLMK